MRNTMTSIAGKTAGHPLQRHGGFSLIELMIVVVILGIVAAFAYPSYTKYVTETRRSEGQRLLLLAAAQQERFYTQCGYYASTFAAAISTPHNCGAAAGAGVLGLTNTLPDVPNYSLVTPIVPAICAACTIVNSYLLTATALGIQATNDTDCGNLTLDSQGIKGQTGPNTQNRCWKR